MLETLHVWGPELFFFGPVYFYYGCVTAVFFEEGGILFSAFFAAGLVGLCYGLYAIYRREMRQLGWFFVSPLVAHSLLASLWLVSPWPMLVTLVVLFTLVSPLFHIVLGLYLLIRNISTPLPTLSLSLFNATYLVSVLAPYVLIAFLTGD